MYAFSPDGNFAYVVDGLGLTRISLARSGVKTVERLAGSVVACAGGLVTTASADGATRLVDAAKLTALTRKKVDLFAVVPHPDGAHLVRCSATRLEILDLEGKELGAISLDRAKPLGRQVLGRPLARKLASLSRLVAIDDSGTVGLYDVRSGALFRVEIPNVAAAIDRGWLRRLVGGGLAAQRAEVPAPIGTLALGVARGEVCLSTFEPSTRTAHALIVASTGAVRTLRRSSLAPIAFDGAVFATQSDEATVLIESRDRAAERVSIPPAAAGAVEVVLRGPHRLVVTPDRESFVDLRTGHHLSRKLPEPELAARQEVCAALRRANLRGAPYDVVFSIDTLRTDGLDGVRPIFSWTCGDQSLFAHLVIGEFVADIVERWRPTTMRPATTLRPTSADELERGLASLDELGVSLTRALPACAHAFENSLGHRMLGQPPPPHQAARIFDSGVGSHFLRALVASASGTSTSVASASREGGAIDVRALSRATATDQPPSGYADDLRTAVAWIVVETLETEAWPILFEWLVAAPNPYAEANTFNASRPAVRLCDLHPAARAPLRAACLEAAASADAKRARRAGDVLRALDTAP